MGSSEGFSVFYPGLIKASDRFGQQASTYESLMPDGGWGCPRGGNNAIDRMMNLTLVALGNAHNITADVIDSHAWKLREVHQAYNAAESDTIAGILNLAYEGGSPLTPIEPQQPNTVPDLAKKHFDPAPISASGLAKISTPQLQNLRYWEYSTAGLGVTGPPSQDPWIGGDLKGLSELANKLQAFSYQSGRVDSRVAGPDGSVIAELNSAVRSLLRKSGEWSGPAAQNFGTAYSRDAANVHVLSDVADKSARTISDLVNKLYSLELRLELAVRSLAERGYRIQRAGDDLVAAAAPGQPRFDQNADMAKITSLFRKLHRQAQLARNAAARQLSEQYQTALGVLKFYMDDTKFRAQTVNINTSQNSRVHGYFKNLKQSADLIREG